MKRLALLLIICSSCIGLFGQRVTGAIIDEVKEVKKNPTGFLVIKVSPSYATVYIDGIRWNGSDQVKMDVGTHEVYAEAEKYTPQTKDFIIEKNKTKILEITLSNTDKVIIGTNVPSLRKIDGFNYPEVLTAEYDLSFGKHTLEFTADGYIPLQKAIDVKISSKNSFFFNLQEAPKQPDSDHMDVTIETNVACYRTLDGVEMGQSQSQTYPITWGGHTLTLNAEGYNPLNTKLNITYQGKNKYHYDLVKQKNGMSGKHEIGVVVGGMNGFSYKYWFTENFSLQGDLAVGLTHYEDILARSGGGVHEQYVYDPVLNMYTWEWINTYYSYRFSGIFDFTLNPNIAYNFVLLQNFYYYLGGGFNIGYMSNLGAVHEVYSDRTFYNERVHMGKFGVNAMMGMEYIFSQKPLSLAFDFRPGYGMAIGDDHEQNSPLTHFFDWKLALSLRYILK